MRSVTPEEARISREKLEEWAKSDIPSSGGKIGQWIYEKRIPILNNNMDKWKKFGRVKKQHITRWFFKTEYQENDSEEEILDYIESLTVGAAQRNWQTPSEFPCCPTEISDTPLEDYLKIYKLENI